MKYLSFFLLLLQTSGLIAESTLLPSELVFRPWWKGGEASLFGIFEPEERTRTGLLLQIPYVRNKGEEFRLFFVRTDRDREHRYFQMIGLGYRSEHFYPVGFQIRLGSSLETYGGAFVSLGLFSNQGSLECFSRKNREEKSVGLLLRSGSWNESNLSLSFERIQGANSIDDEDRISLGAVWSWSFLVGEAGLKEGTTNIIGTSAIGFSPFEWGSTEEKPKPSLSKKEEPIPILSPEDLLKLGFSVSESLSISSASRKDPEIFRNVLLGLSPQKRKKIQWFLRKKAGGLK